MDIKDFYLNFYLEICEYVYIDLYLILQEFINQYNLNAITKDGKVLSEVY
jgi:hypothetical protein